jgi:hypothetical protein
MQDTARVSNYHSSTGSGVGNRAEKAIGNLKVVALYLQP